MRAIWKIWNVLTAVIRVVTENIVEGMITQLSLIQNFEIVTIEIDMQTDITSINTLRFVTMVLYRRWRVNARSLSMETPLRIAKDIPPVIHPMKNCDSLSLQYALNLPSSSAVLKATKNGWPSSPTRKSENARQNSNVNDVELSCLDLQITSIIVPLPKTAAKANSELTTHEIILKVPWLDCRQKTSRKKHVRFVSFLFRLLVAIDWSSFLVQVQRFFSVVLAVKLKWILSIRPTYMFSGYQYKGLLEEDVVFLGRISFDCRFEICTIASTSSWLHAIQSFTWVMLLHCYFSMK